MTKWTFRFSPTIECKQMIAAYLINLLIFTLACLCIHDRHLISQKQGHYFLFAKINFPFNILNMRLSINKYGSSYFDCFCCFQSNQHWLLKALGWPHKFVYKIIFGNFAGFLFHFWNYWVFYHLPFVYNVTFTHYLW